MEFYVRDGDRFQGPAHLLVAKDTGRPLRIEMTDPQRHGSMHIDYSFDKINDIELPDCMSKGQQSRLLQPLIHHKNQLWPSLEWSFAKEERLQLDWRIEPCVR